jgi:hypothetical protein
MIISSIIIITWILSLGGFIDNDSVMEPIDNSYLNDMYSQELEQSLIKAMQIINDNSVEKNLLSIRADQLMIIDDLQKQAIKKLSRELDILYKYMELQIEKSNNK